MKIEKLPSGSYRIQKQIRGRRKSFTFDHKPTQREIAEVLAKSIDAVNGDTTFTQAAESYIEARTNTLSPTTIRSYKQILRDIPDTFKELEIDDIGSNDVQKVVNCKAKDRSPKTVRNYHGFISAVLGEFRPSLQLHTHLPMKDKKEPYIPTSDDIKAILEYAKGSAYEVPILLGCASLRRSEICALTMDDIEGNIIHVTKGKVLNENKEWVIKKPKTSTSIRDVYVPDSVIETINRQGLYQGYPEVISHYMRRAQDALGLPHFSLHKCRHYFASAAHEAGVSDVDIMKAGGWKTDHVMKTVYRHSLAKDNSAATNAVFDTLL